MYAAATVGRLIHPVAGAVGKAGDARDTFREAVASEELLNALDAGPGDWLRVSRQGLLADEGADEPWMVRLVEAGQAAVCPLPAKKANAPALFLPSGVIEGLKATPGRSMVAVRQRQEAEGAVPAAGRLVLARLHAPDGAHRRYQGALKSFFSVPRVLRQGEVFSVPVGGLPRCLHEIEGGSASVWSGDVADDEDDDGSEAEGSGFGDMRPAVHPAETTGSRVGLDPICGLAFTRLISFRVQSVSPAASSGAGPPGAGSRCYRVEKSSTEVMVQGSCHARGLPYIASHLLCRAPPPLPATLRAPFERLLGALAPAVRSWMQQPAGGSVAVPHTVLVHGPRGCGKRLLWRAICDRLGLQLMEANCISLVAQSPGAVEEAVQKLVATAASSSPVVLCLRRLHALAAGGPSMSPQALLLLQRRLEGALTGALGRAHEGQGSEPGPLVVLAGTCEEIDDVGGPVRKAFQVEVALRRPDEGARKEAVAQLLGVYRQGGEAKPSGDEPDPLVAAIAKLSAGLTYADLRSVCSEVALCECLHPGRTAEDRAEQAVKRIQGGSKVAVQLASKVQWADVGGLQDAKDEVMNCITLPLTSGPMVAAGEKLRSGILLFGPPGTGKTLLAKAVATECRVHFLSVKGPELLSMYIGESEKNVRSLFQTARELAPCVLFFDELDSLAPARGRGSDSGGVMDRVVSQLLTELDSLPATVFLIGATNRPDLLDRSLLRPGRLDRMVYLGVAKDKLPLLKAVTRKFDLIDEPAEEMNGDGDLLRAVSMSCPPNLTGADVSVLCADAYTTAQKDKIELLHDVASRVQTSISTLLLFLEALEQLPEKDGGAAEPSWSDAFSLVYPEQPGGVQELPVGLALFRCKLAPGAFVLAHRLSHPGAGGASDAAVIFETGPLDAGGRPPSTAAVAAATADGRLEERWAAFCGAPKAKKGASSAPASSTPCAGVVQGLCPFSALRVRVGRRHFQTALRNLQPSVPMEDLQRYEALGREHQNTKK